jgi:hypothetical protein
MQHPLDRLPASFHLTTAVIAGELNPILRLDVLRPLALLAHAHEQPARANRTANLNNLSDIHTKSIDA